MRRSFLLLMFLWAAVLNMAAHTYVVCVGISDYPGRGNDLRLSANDAVTIYNIYVKNCNATAICLTNQRATAQNIGQAMWRVYSRARANDVVLFYFSGHGVQGGLVCYDGIVAYNDFFAMMKRCPARHKVIIADACYSGKMRGGGRSYRPDNKQVMLFLASRSNEKSMEMSGLRNSVFTAYLSRGLRGGADYDRNRTITARELYNYVHNGVIRKTRGRQHPVMWGNFSNNMPIIRW